MLYSRFFKFIKSIQTGNKSAAKLLLELIKNNTETITGRNIKKILMETDKRNIENVDSKILGRLTFCEISEADEWRISSIKELTDIKQGKLVIQFENDVGMESDEIEDILTFLTTS